MLPLVVLELHREAVGANARVVHEHEDRAEALLELSEELLHRIRIDNVALHGHCLAAGGLDLGDHRRGAFVVGAVVHAHRPALGSERLRDRRADSARGACDECATLMRHRSAPIP